MSDPSAGDATRPTLAYASAGVDTLSSIRRACAAAMFVGGILVFAGFCRDAFLWLAFGAGDSDVNLVSLEAVPLYVELARGIASACTVVAGLACWRGHWDRFTECALAAWTVATIADWVVELLMQAGQLDAFGDADGFAYIAVNLIVDALPIVLPALLWWVVRRTRAG